MTDNINEQLESTEPSPRRWWIRGIGLVFTIVILLVASFELVYAGKVFPGISADGVPLGGLSSGDAKVKVLDATKTYSSAILPITYNKTTLHVPVKSLSLIYDTDKVTSLAYSYGRTGGVFRRLHEQARALLGRDTAFAAYNYDDNQLTPYLKQVSDDVSTPVSNASLSFTGTSASVVPASDGTRLDLGLTILTLESRLAATSDSAAAASIYKLPAAVTTQSLTAAIPQVETNLAGAINLSYDTQTKTIDQATIASWIKVSGKAPGEFLETNDIRDFYPTASVATLALDPASITAYVSTLASQINQSATNAQLAMVSGQLTVTAASKTGIELDQPAAIKSIDNAVTSKDANRDLRLSVKTAQAAVREDNLADLGIVEQISEGETYFPGSPSTRLTNVRAGAAKFNDVLLAPGEQFSFGKILGEVDASTGYVPELVILGDHEEKQYGGGLCQVSSTAFRAALAAGLPINERVNHAFAISYYTWPYAAPGVDATIYYPDVDFKFTNDTGHYILMQTIMNGVDLKFDFFGTKTKTGVVRGPNFVTGNSDPKQPSHTVFYRDVMDLSGNVIKTDTFNTYYKSSTDYPVQKTGYN